MSKAIYASQEDTPLFRVTCRGDGKKIVYVLAVDAPEAAALAIEYLDMAWPDGAWLVDRMKRCARAGVITPNPNEFTDARLDVSVE